MQTFKRVLVTGSEGMIGRELVLLLKERGCEVFRFDIKRFWSLSSIEHEDKYCFECGNQVSKIPMDITDYKLTKEIVEAFKPDTIFHLFGIKGNPKMTKERPADFMIPMLQGDTNMIRIAQECGVKNFLYTSSIAVLNPESDKYPSWAKETSEKLIEAMRIQYPEGTKYSIVRPANVYGRFDNFNNPDAMVITSLIKRGIETTNSVLEVWGDGSAERDFINAKDVVRAMILTMEQMPPLPVNICTGRLYSIASIAEIIAKELNLDIMYTGEGVRGAKSKGMDKHVLNAMGFLPKIRLDSGIREVIDYVRNNRSTSS